MLRRARDTHSTTRRSRRRPELRSKLLQFITIEIADRQKAQVLFGPAQNIEALHDLELGRRQYQPEALRHEQIDDVNAPPIDEHRYRLAVDVVEPPPDQPEAFSGEIDDGWREIDTPIEPRLHRVLIGRFDVGQ